MAYKNLIAFGAGEITPELYERGNLEKFRTGLAKLRNAFVTKIGGLKSRSGTRYSFVPKDNNDSVYYYVEELEVLLEMSTTHARLYSSFNNDTKTFNVATECTFASYVPYSTDLTKVSFTYYKKTIYIAEPYSLLKALDINAATVYVAGSEFTLLPTTQLGGSISFGITPTGSPGGYDVEYIFTFVYDDRETFKDFSIVLSGKKPVSTGQYNTLTATFDTSHADFKGLPSEVHLYQRPKQSGEFFLISSSKDLPIVSGVNRTYTIIDHGAELKLTSTAPSYLKDFTLESTPFLGLPSVPAVYANSVGVYQDRLVFSGKINPNRVVASQTGTRLMSTVTPTRDDSAVSMKLGADGGLKVLKFFDGRGLMIFTTKGMYETASDILTPSSAYAIRRAPNVVTDRVDPVMVGPYVTIFDSQLRAVIAFSPSGGSDYSFNSTEFSIYSSHLFKDREVVSWTLQNDDTQILWIVMDDGDVLSFSFQNEQQLRAWARHDFQGDVKQVFTISQPGQKDIVMFNVKRGDTNTVEALTDRTAQFKEYIATDATVYYSENLLASIAALEAVIAPVTPGDWDGSLTITPDSSGFGNAPGDVVRAYYSEHEYVDMTVTDNTLGVLTVTPEAEYPSSLATITKLYKVYSGTLTGLTHLKGQKVSVRIDGFTHASPLNTDKQYTEYTVDNSGEITLDPEVSGAFISVGLPVVTDIQTLEIDTVEQAPTKLESQIVNSLWISYFESLFLYAGAHYPDDDTVTDMDSQEYQVEPDGGISNMIPPLPQSERLEMQIHSDWKSKGSVALRNVDPQPIAIRALIPDTEVVRKR